MMPKTITSTVNVYLVDGEHPVLLEVVIGKRKPLRFGLDLQDAEDLGNALLQAVREQLRVN